MLHKGKTDKTNRNTVKVTLDFWLPRVTVSVASASTSTAWTQAQGRRLQGVCPAEAPERQMLDVLASSFKWGGIWNTTSCNFNWNVQFTYFKTKKYVRTPLQGKCHGWRLWEAGFSSAPFHLLTHLFKYVLKSSSVSWCWLKGSLYHLIIFYFW